jgi:peroxiredoxin
MARFWAIAAVICFAMTVSFTQAGGGKDKDKGKDKPFMAKGTFTKDDPKDAQRNGPTQLHVVPMKAGKVYIIDLEGMNIDLYLRLLDPKGNQLEEDDDSGGNLNARISFSCTKDGDYQVVCTTVGAAGVGGSYALTVKTTGTIQPPATAHAQMVGKPAPDFASDFALNGKAGKLSGLKGKVVLLAFLDLRSSSCVALLPRLNEWHKAHQKDGLAVVGVTLYGSELGQKLGWDAENAKVATIAKADRKSDQALLKEFAAYHKIEFTLAALTKDVAFPAYDSYVVNGVPQLVLIDQKGMIRQIDINGDKNATQVATEIKKALAEK